MSIVDVAARLGNPHLAALYLVPATTERRLTEAEAGLLSQALDAAEQALHQALLERELCGRWERRALEMTRALHRLAMAFGQPERALGDAGAFIDAVVARLGYQARLMRARGDDIASVPLQLVALAAEQVLSAEQVSVLLDHINIIELERMPSEPAELGELMREAAGLDARTVSILREVAAELAGEPEALAGALLALRHHLASHRDLVGLTTGAMERVLDDLAAIGSVLEHAGVAVARETIAEWTTAERRQAFDWAAAVCLGRLAPPRPACVPVAVLEEVR
jgi:hypothetical protein